MNKRASGGILFMGLTFVAVFTIIMGHYFTLAVNTEYAAAADEQSKLKISVESGNGNIYDRNMKLLVNEDTQNIAVAVPQGIDPEEVSKFAADKEEFSEKYKQGEPFTFVCSEELQETNGITVFSVPVRYSENQTAQHVVGYTSQGKGVSGIEYAYDNILRDNYSENSVTYSVDGLGRVLIGEDKEVIRCGDVSGGVVLTLDKEIQKICEKSGKNIEKGAVVVTDIESGDILAMASFPNYSVYNLEEAVNSRDSAMINRTLYSYSVGSIFKLVTSCEAIQEGFEGYVYGCEGSVDVGGQIFRCHKLDGHGCQSMKDAVVNSCNTYFISLSRLFDVQRFRETAFNLGFGREIHLCSGMTASGGILPDIEDLLIPAELANFSFGQGKLTATPLQISQLTCAIANEGKMPVLRLIKGVSYNGEDIVNEKKARFADVMENDTANQLKRMMISAVYENEDSNAKPVYSSAGVKTSTAQTGRRNDDGSELYNAWITGFFPAFDPKYAVTVLVEDGGYGNDSAAPIFKEIADKITKLDKRD